MCLLTFAKHEETFAFKQIKCLSGLCSYDALLVQSGFNVPERASFKSESLASSAVMLLM